MSDAGEPRHPGAAAPPADEGDDRRALRAAVEEQRSLRQAAERYVEALSSKALDLAITEESLREQIAIVDEQRRLFEQVFEASTAGLALADAGLRVMKVNPAYRALTPHPEIEPVGRTFEEIWSGVVPVSGPALVGPGLRGVLETGAPLHLDGYEVMFPDGTRHVFASHVKRVLHGGRPGLLGALWETTDLVLARRAAEAAAADAARIAAVRDAVISSMPHGVLVYDSEGRIVRANAAAKAVFGYSDEEASLPAAERIARLRLRGEDGRPVPWERLPPLRALQGETVSAETYAMAPAVPGDRPRWLLMSAAPIRDAEGGQVGAVGAFIDVTRERELAEMREDLLRMISHDLRTPLQAVLTHAHLIRRTPGLPPHVGERAHAIVRTGERMTGMLQDLVEMVLLESGHLTLARVPVDLPAFVRDVLERLAAALPPERIRVAVEPPVPAVSADPARLERVVVNLLSNALKYSPPEAPVDLRVGPAPRGAARMEVTDRGVGIAPEDVPRIFGRFYRVGGKRQPEGLGLGLYISRLVVEAHGGRIDVETAPGRGSRFVVELPAVP